MKIYVDFEIPENPIAFIEKFYEDDFTYKAVKSGKRTYYDKECKRIQCSVDRYRSFDDLYDLITTYYPNTKPEDLIFYICSANIKLTGRYINGHSRKFINNEDLLIPRFSSCIDILRIRVFYINPLVSNNIYTEEKYNSKFSWSELFQKVNVKNTYELEKYIYDCQLKRKIELNKEKELITDLNQ